MIFFLRQKENFKKCGKYHNLAGPGPKAQMPHHFTVY